MLYYALFLLILYLPSFSKSSSICGIYFSPDDPFSEAYIGFNYYILQREGEANTGSGCILTSVSKMGNIDNWRANTTPGPRIFLPGLSYIIIWLCLVPIWLALHYKTDFVTFLLEWLIFYLTGLCSFLTRLH